MRITYLSATAVLYRAVRILLFYPFRSTFFTAILLGGPAFPSVAFAEGWTEGMKSLHPYASAAMTYDTNLLRVSGISELPFGTKKSDSYSTLAAGFDSDFKISRQDFLFDGEVYRINYQRFDEFNHTGGAAHALWKWARGDLWAGELGYTFNRTMASFANQTIPKNEIRTENMVHGEAGRWLTDKLRLNVGGGLQTTNFSEDETLDRERHIGGVEIEYLTHSGNFLGFETKGSTGTFKNDAIRDYRELHVGPTAKWQLTGKTSLRAKAGYTRRDHDNVSQEDYAGFIGRLSADWKASPGFKIDASLWREISSLGDQINNYALIHGIRIEPTLQIASKTSLRLFTDYQDHDYKNAAPSTDPQRQDKLYGAGLWVDWNLYQNVSTSLGYNAEKRTSTRITDEYNDQIFLVQLKVGL